jgi:hypothetical protein
MHLVLSTTYSKNNLVMSSKWLWLRCLTSLSTIFQLYGGGHAVLLVEETDVPGETHWTVESHWQSLSHNVVSSTPRHQQDLNSQL